MVQTVHDFCLRAGPSSSSWTLNLTYQCTQVATFEDTIVNTYSTSTTSSVQRPSSAGNRGRFCPIRPRRRAEMLSRCLLTCQWSH